MIRVSVMYPRAPGARSDRDYYLGTHVPLLERRLGAALQGITVDRGLGGPEPGTEAPFTAMVHMRFESVDAFQAAFGPHAAQIQGDVANYTDIQPVIQISDAVR